MELDINYKFTWENYQKNIVDYFSYIWEEKSLGPTNHERRSVEGELGKFLPNSLRLIFPAFIFSVFFGILKGIFDYRNKNKKKNVIGNGLTFFLQSVPDFFLIIGIQWIILMILSMPLYTFDEGQWYGFLLPSLLISMYPMMYLERITSSALANEDGNYYVLVAKAKGFPEKIVIYRHILRNSLQSILSHLGTIMLLIITGLIMVENLSAYDGIGSRLITAFSFNELFSMGSYSQFEPAMVIGIGVCFLLIVLVSQVIGLLLKKCFRLP
ncbi:ABC transporter permease [Bacillaceae bacterium Marseille-Q3522]|nr:ABC transporter permease [Bacillaceae bacterium Marseille-Q3522]